MSGPSEVLTVEKIRAATEVVKLCCNSPKQFWTALQLEAEEFLRQQFSGGKTTGTSQPPLKTELQEAAERGFAGALKAEE